MIPLTGYLDRLSARPGERIEVKVSSQLATPYRVDLLRIIHADPNPAGPGMKLEELPDGFTGTFPSRAQPVQRGSCGAIRLPKDLRWPDSFTLALRVQPWLLDGRVQTVLALRSGGVALFLRVAAEGAELELRAPHGAVARAQVPAPMRVRGWYELRAVVEPGRCTLHQTALQASWGLADSGQAEAAWTERFASGGEIMLAAEWRSEPGSWRRCFNGRLEDPLLLRGAHHAPLPDPETLTGGALIAWWDFSEEIPGQRILDRGPHVMHGALRNLPTRAVRGSRWTGQEMCWRHAPRDYAAIHFHEDDLSDCGWQTDFTLEIPADLRSGVYGVRLRGEGKEEIIPFYVLPPRGTARAPVAFLASTFTYQAYFNHARGNVDDGYRARRAAWQAYPHNPDGHPDYAHSTYNRHPDGSGVCYSSARRPLLTMRPGFLTFNDARGSGLRHFPADSHLTDWLETKGFEFDVITDHDLHREGLELLRPYRAVLTGSHPEYHTPRTLDALRDYVSEGGRLCYLGGNGFYWRIAVSDEVPDVLEVRRAEGGIRAWAAEPGEYYHALDGGYGGLWRRNGRPPQMLAGVGFSGQGLFEGSHYRRLPDSYDSRAAWIFEGIPDEIIGDFGLSGGGAAGFELDRADPVLGSPPNLLMLARSEQHQAHFIPVPEELLSHLHTITGEKPADLIRAEIVYFETAKGGAVFSTGSITFCGSLSHDNYDNNVSRMLENVLRRFSAPTT